MGPEEVSCENMDCFFSRQGSVVNTAMSLRVPQTVGNSLIIISTSKTDDFAL
jgi:hypothetical protein